MLGIQLASVFVTGKSKPMFQPCSWAAEWQWACDNILTVSFLPYKNGANGMDLTVSPCTYPEIVDASTHSGTSERANYKSVSFPYNHTKPTQPHMFLSSSSFSKIPKLQGRGERIQRREDGSNTSVPLLTLSQNSAGGTGVICHRNRYPPEPGTQGGEEGRHCNRSSVSG